MDQYLDQQLIAIKLESLQRCLQRVAEKCPEDVAVLQQDLDLQDIVVLNLTRAVQLCVDIAAHIVSTSTETTPATMAETFTMLEKLAILDQKTTESLRRSVGFRNVAVHNYDDVDWHIVFAICKHHHQDFKMFAKQVIKYSGL